MELCNNCKKRFLQTHFKKLRSTVLQNHHCYNQKPGSLGQSRPVIIRNHIIKDLITRLLNPCNLIFSSLRLENGLTKHVQNIAKRPVMVFLTIFRVI